MRGLVNPVADQTETPDELAAADEHAGAVAYLAACALTEPTPYSADDWHWDDMSRAEQRLAAMAAQAAVAERDAEITHLRAELATTKASLHDARWMARDVLASRAAEIEQLQAEVAAHGHDLVYRLAAADRDWCDEIGDTPATPQYIHHLAEHITATQDASCPDTTPPVREPRVWPAPGDRVAWTLTLGTVPAGAPGAVTAVDGRTAVVAWDQGGENRVYTRHLRPLTEVLPSAPGGES